MTKEDIYKVVYRVLSEVYELEGANSVDHTLGQIMGIMNLALEIENVVLAEAPKKPEHDGCKDCKHSRKEKWEEPCLKCKMNYTDKWEKRDD